MLTQRELTRHLRQAVQAARAVGPLLLRWAGRPTRVTTKRTSIDLVTEVDRRAERIIFRRLNRATPRYGFIGEESDRVHPQADYHWCVDPIDGTTNFIHGFPLFSVSIALIDREQPLVGVVYNPTHQELFTAIRGRGSFFNGRRMRVSRVSALSRSLFATGFPTEFRRHPRKFMRPFQALQLKTHAVRRAGSAALNLAYVACGRLEGVWEDRIWPWDVAAAMLMIREAGGRVSTLQGKTFTLTDQQMLATNGRVHQAALTVLRRSRAS